MRIIMKLIHRIKPPCQKCPYRLGQIQTYANPCVECKAGGFKIYEQFVRATKLGTDGTDNTP
jgi:hypothetical protein